MSFLKIGGIVGAGGLGVLAAGMIVSNILKTGLDWIFGLALIIFVVAGAGALLAKNFG